MTNAVNVEPIYETFGVRLRRAREAAGLTKKQVGSRLREPRTEGSIAFIEQGKQRVPLHLAAELAAIIGADLRELLAPSEARARFEALGDE